MKQITWKKRSVQNQTVILLVFITYKAEQKTSFLIWNAPTENETSSYT
jgi:hypothetical protein